MGAGIGIPVGIPIGIPRKAQEAVFPVVEALGTLNNQSPFRGLQTWSSQIYMCK